MALPDYSKVQVPYLTDEQIRNTADAIREKYWGEKIPVHVEVIAEKGFGLLFTPIGSLRQLANTEAFLLSNLQEIVCEIDSPQVRLRFSIAHELGDKVLHSTAISILQASSYADWKMVLDTIPAWLWERAEYQAREFAGRLLVPRDQLISSINNLRDLLRQLKDLGIQPEPELLCAYIAPRISKAFNLSEDAMARRLRKEEIDFSSFFVQDNRPFQKHFRDDKKWIKQKPRSSNSYFGAYPL